jgi:hypothetical protein
LSNNTTAYSRYRFVFLTSFGPYPGLGQWKLYSKTTYLKGVSISSLGQYISTIVNNGYIYTSNVALPTGTVDQFSYSLGRLNNVDGSSTNSYIFNLDNGSTFFLTGTAPTANYSINFTISILNPSRSYLITVINKTSSVASHYCNAVSINGISVPSERLLYTVKPANIVLTGAVKTNQEFVLFYNSTISAWFVNTNLKIFKVA